LGTAYLSALKNSTGAFSPSTDGVELGIGELNADDVHRRDR
jgi:hypothetical protein